jgi:hypothetical protein
LQDDVGEDAAYDDAPDHVAGDHALPLQAAVPPPARLGKAARRRRRRPAAAAPPDSSSIDVAHPARLPPRDSGDDRDVLLEHPIALGAAHPTVVAQINRYKQLLLAVTPCLQDFAALRGLHLRDSMVVWDDSMQLTRIYFLYEGEIDTEADHGIREILALPAQCMGLPPPRPLMVRSIINDV